MDDKFGWPSPPLRGRRLAPFPISAWRYIESLAAGRAVLLESGFSTGPCFRLTERLVLVFSTQPPVTSPFLPIGFFSPHPLISAGTRGDSLLLARGLRCLVLFTNTRTASFPPFLLTASRRMSSLRVLYMAAGFCHLSRSCTSSPPPRRRKSPLTEPCGRLKPTVVNRGGFWTGGSLPVSALLPRYLFCLC